MSILVFSESRNVSNFFFSNFFQRDNCHNHGFYLSIKIKRIGFTAYLIVPPLSPIDNVPQIVPQSDIASSTPSLRKYLILSKSCQVCKVETRMCFETNRIHVVIELKTENFMNLIRVGFVPGSFDERLQRPKTCTERLVH